METLPTLHPIVIKPISEPPFECSGKGLTFKGHSRDSIADLKSWLFPKRKNVEPLKKLKDWWLAQLRLYGIPAKPSTKVADLVTLLKDALSAGLESPPEEILQLELRLDREFLLQNAEARNQEYASLDDEKKAEKYSEKFLREKFFNGRNKEKLLVLKIDGRPQVHRAAKELGLHTISADAPGAQGNRWIVIGRNRDDVWRRSVDIEKDRHEWEEGKRNAKRRKIELRRQACEAGGKGSFKDIVGEWSIECPQMDSEYKNAERTMSIFFYKPPKVYHSASDSKEGESSGDEEDEEIASQEELPPLLLCANFEMGILEGILRSSIELPAPSTRFPVTAVPFTWRGRETGMGETQLDYNGKTNLGSFKFLSKTQLEGILKSNFGNFPFTGCKVDKVPVQKSYDWDQYNASRYEFERVSRWR